MLARTRGAAGAVEAIRAQLAVDRLRAAPPLANLFVSALVEAPYEVLMNMGAFAGTAEAPYRDNAGGLSMCAWCC